MGTEISLQTIERDIREAEENIERQQQIVAELRRDGHASHGAEILLQLFWDLLRTRERTLALLRQSQSVLGPDTSSGPLSP